MQTRRSEKHFAECLHLDKESDGGRWLLTYDDGSPLIYRLRIAPGGPADWYSFSAEISLNGIDWIVLGEFDISPTKLFPPTSPRHVVDVAVWDPVDEADFLTIRPEFRGTFAMMVRNWGSVAGVAVPVSA